MVWQAKATQKVQIRVRYKKQVPQSEKDQIKLVEIPNGLKVIVPRYKTVPSALTTSSETSKPALDPKLSQINTQTSSLREDTRPGATAGTPTASLPKEAPGNSCADFTAIIVMAFILFLLTSIARLFNDDEASKDKAHMGCFYLLFIPFLISFCSEESTLKRQQDRQEHQATLNKPIEEANLEVNSFLKKASPELLSKLALIESEIKEIKNDIKELNNLMKKFPDQAKLIINRITILEDVKQHLIDSSQKIEQDVRTAYVTYKIDEIGGKKSFDKTREDLLNKAKESINYAKELKESLKEITDH